MISKEEELNHIRTKIIVLQVIDFPGAIMLGLGLYALFGANGNAFIDILNNQTVAYALTGSGAAIMVWVMVKMIPLFKRKAELQKAE